MELYYSNWITILEWHNLFDPDDVVRRMKEARTHELEQLIYSIH